MPSYAAVQEGQARDAVPVYLLNHLKRLLQLCLLLRSSKPRKCLLFPDNYELKHPSKKGGGREGNETMMTARPYKLLFSENTFYSDV